MRARNDVTVLENLTNGMLRRVSLSHSHLSATYKCFLCSFFSGKEKPSVSDKALLPSSALFGELFVIRQYAKHLCGILSFFFFFIFLAISLISVSAPHLVILYFLFPVAFSLMCFFSLCFCYLCCKHTII